MLVLSRKVSETIVINGNIRVTVTAVRGKEVRVAVEAPREVPIHREELLHGPGTHGRTDRVVSQGVPSV